MNTALALLLALACRADTRASAANIQWKAATVNVLLSNTALHTWNLTVAAVRPVYSGDDAHTGAAISFTATTKSGILFEGTCVCIPPHWEADTVIRSLQQTQLAAAQGFMTLERVGVVYVKTYGPHWNASRGLWKRSYVLSVSPRHGVTLTATLNSSGCAKLRTEGYWADSSSWVGHAVPTTTSTAILPADSGVVFVQHDVRVARLRMFDGSLHASQTTCPSSWVPLVQRCARRSPPRVAHSSRSSKCFKRFKHTLTQEQAQAYCQSRRGRLAQPASIEEAGLVKQMCRGVGGGSCWIGLMRGPANSTEFRWLDDSQQQHLTAAGFPWARHEPDNSTYHSQGENCVCVRSWEEDWASCAAPAWEDAWCGAERAFVCESVGHTLAITLTAAYTSTLTGGELVGGTFVFEQGLTINASSAVSHAMVQLRAGTSDWLAGSIRLNEYTVVEVCPGAQLYVHTSSPYSSVHDSVPHSLARISANKSAACAVGESTEDAPPPTLRVHSAAVLVASTNSTMPLELSLLLELHGTMQVYGNVVLAHGGVLANGSINIHAGSALSIQGASLMHQHDVYTLRVSASRAVLGAWTGIPTAETSQLGVYRLSLTRGAVQQRTACIPFDSSATQVAAALRALSSLEYWGGVTVRRSGDGSSSYEFGYVYTIDLDAEGTSLLGSAYSPLHLACVGASACGCADVLVEGCPAPGSIHSCAPHGHYVFNLSSYHYVNASTGHAGSALTLPHLCAETPKVSLVRALARGATALSGAGTLVLNGGSHRLPPQLATTLVVAAGKGYVLSDAFIGHEVRTALEGTLVFAGAGYAGLDAATGFFTRIAALDASNEPWLLHVPTFTGVFTNMSTAEEGRMFFASRNASMTVSTLALQGGCIGGSIRLSVKTHLRVRSSATKQIRYGLQLFTSALVTWTGGDIGMAEGSNIHILGKAVFSPTNATLGRLVNAGVSSTLLLQGGLVPSYSTTFADYRYSAMYIARRTWLTDPALIVYGQASVTVLNNSNIMLALGTRLNGTLVVLKNATVELNGLGLCTSKAVVDVYSHGTLRLTGHSFTMSTGCTIKGRGTLHVAGGEHHLPSTLDVLLRITGGTARQVLDVLNLNGGLSIAGEGKLVVDEATRKGSSLKVAVAGDVVISGGLWLFPETNASPDPSMSDSWFAPRGRRASVSVTGDVQWFAGQIAGSVDIITTSDILLDGSIKTLGSQAQIVSYGHARWGSGDLMIDAGANLRILNTVELLRPKETVSAGMMYNAGGGLENQYKPLTIHGWSTDEYTAN